MLNGEIYIIRPIKEDNQLKVYIGSTICGSRNRYLKHKSEYKRGLMGKMRHRVRSCDVFDEYGVTECMVEVLGTYTVDNIRELRRKEGEIINQYKITTDDEGNKKYKVVNNNPP